MDFFIAKTEWREPEGFELYRESIGDMYIFVHFLTPVILHDNGKDINIHSGGCIFFEPNSKQHFSSPDCVLVHDWFHVDKSCKYLIEKYALLPNTVYYPENSAEISGIIREIELEYLKKAEFYTEISDAAAEKLCIKLARSKSAPQNTNDIEKHKKEFVHIRSLIHTQYAQQWSVEDMARLVNLSSSRFYTLYKKIFGISPTKDLYITRIQRAQILLMRSDYTIEQVAELTGYNNPYHFIRQFKQITGTTPGKYH